MGPPHFIIVLCRDVFLLKLGQHGLVTPTSSQFLENQLYREIVSPQQDFVFIPDKYDSDQNKLKTTNKVPLDTGRLSKDTKNYLYNLEELLRLRPELIEASTKVDEQIANIVGARSQFQATTNLGLVNDQVLLSNSESRRKLLEAM